MLFINASEQFKSMLSQPALRIDEIRASETGSLAMVRRALSNRQSALIDLVSCP